ncbi:hypothetical protein LCGC14_0740330 [marine sediment metagenome]|uniref:Uncharacterized protein n=1 Tax=marine sediment metagenome TaxID=412755 RepID=A0A0F9QB67_9ZZZZ
MKYVYTQDDVKALTAQGKAYRSNEIIYLTPITKGTTVEIEGGSRAGDLKKATKGAVATDGDQVWLVTPEEIEYDLQPTKRPPAVEKKQGPTPPAKKK